MKTVSLNVLEDRTCGYILPMNFSMGGFFFLLAIKLFN